MKKTNKVPDGMTGLALVAEPRPASKKPCQPCTPDNEARLRAQ